MESMESIPVDVSDKVSASNLLMMKLLKQHLPKHENVFDCASIPETEEDWVSCLMLLIFDSCALSFNFAESGFLPKLGFNKTFENEDCISYWVGSFREGVGCYIPGNASDTDVMNVLKNYIATTFNSSVSPHEHRHIVVLQNGSYPCYVKLSNNDSEVVEKLVKMSDKMNYGPVIRSKQDERLLNHTFEFDNSMAVECQSWPVESARWEERVRSSGWPERKLLTECVNMPCYIVPKPHANNSNDRREWRYSFARQEGILMSSLSDEVKMLYIISKFLVKQRLINDELFSTYHLKTLLLWHREEKSKERFESCSLNTNVCQFIDFVVKQLEEHTVKHFFVEDNNMTEHIPSTEISKIINEFKFIRTNTLDVLKNITESKRYPFTVCSLASTVTQRRLSNQEIYTRLQTNVVFILIENLFQTTGYNKARAKLFIKHLNSLNIHKEGTEFLPMVLSSHKENLKYARELFATNDAFTALMLLSATLYEEIRTTFPSLPSMSLTSCGIYAEQELAFIHPCAKVFRFLGLKQSMRYTQTLCKMIQEVVHKNNWKQSVLMLSMKEMFANLNRLNEGDHSHQLSRLRQIAIYLQAFNQDIEVSIATVIRFQKSSSQILDICHTFSSFFDGVSMYGVLKHLVYAVILTAEEKEENLPGEKEAIGKTVHDFLKHFTDKLQVFLCVIAIAVLGKSYNEDTVSISRFIDLLIKSRLPSEFNDVSKMCSDVQDILSSETVDFEKVFLFAEEYAQKCCHKDGVKVVVDILDDLLKPEHNLGVLVGIGLSSDTELGKAIELLQLWVHRSIEAPVVQRDGLYSMVYGRLGHLYHIKAVNNKTSTFNTDASLADVMLQTANQEDSGDLAVKVNMILLAKQYRPKRIQSLLEDALATDDPTKISVYYSESAGIFDEDLDKIKAKVEEDKMFAVSSLVLINYIALKLYNTVEHKKEYTRTKLISNMETTVGKLEQIALMSNHESQTDIQTLVLANSHVVIGLSYLESQSDIDNAKDHLTKAKELNSECKLTQQWLTTCQNMSTSSTSGKTE